MNADDVRRMALATVPPRYRPRRVFDWRVDCPPQDVGGRRFPAVVGRGRGKPLGHG